MPVSDACWVPCCRDQLGVQVFSKGKDPGATKNGAPYVGVDRVNLAISFYLALVIGAPCPRLGGGPGPGSSRGSPPSAGGVGVGPWGGLPVLPSSGYVGRQVHVRAIRGGSLYLVVAGPVRAPLQPGGDRLLSAEHGQIPCVHTDSIVAGHMYGASISLLTVALLHVLMYLQLSLPLPGSVLLLVRGPSVPIMGLESW